MKRHITFYLVLAFIVILTNSSNCGGDDPKINYEYGFFADSSINLAGINSTYDDLNMALPQITMSLPVMFSSNRNSSGADFDIVPGIIGYNFNQIDGTFILTSDNYNTDFYNFLASSVNGDGDEFGPTRLFNGKDGKEYFFVASEGTGNNLDLVYMSYFPSGGLTPPSTAVVENVSILNSASNEAYLTFDWNFEKAYYCSDRGGDYDIYENEVDLTPGFAGWLGSDFEAGMPTDSINSDFDDKCPFIIDDYLVFASDRPGGMGGFDLYISTFADGKWSSPKNMGPDINTQYNEYRPVINFANGFTNLFMIYSSDRPGGLGGYDLYLQGLDEEL